MSSQQKIFTDLIKQEILKYEGMQVATRPQYSNTGTIAAVRATGASVVEVGYYFQDSIMDLTISSLDRQSGRMVQLLSQPPRTGYFNFYMSYHDESAHAFFFRRLREALASHASARASGSPLQGATSAGARETVAVDASHLRDLLQAALRPKFKGQTERIRFSAKRIKNALPGGLAKDIDQYVQDMVAATTGA